MNMKDSGILKKKFPKHQEVWAIQCQQLKEKTDILFKEGTLIK
jgi:hypothetical protein